MSEEAASFTQHYYLDLAAAFVRGRMPDAPSLPPAELVRFGLQAGLRLHKFQRTGELPRVRKCWGCCAETHFVPP